MANNNNNILMKYTPRLTEYLVGINKSSNSQKYLLH